MKMKKKRRIFKRCMEFEKSDPTDCAEYSLNSFNLNRKHHIILYNKQKKKKKTI
jgi:hypothetical protein